MNIQTFNKLSGYIRDIDNFDKDHFKELLHSAMNDNSFDIDFTPKLEKEISSDDIHKNQKKIFRREQNLFCIAFDAGNFDATFLLIEAGANFFSVSEKYILVQTYNNEGEITGLDPLRNEQKWPIESLDAQFTHSKSATLKDKIMALCIERFRSDEYNEKEFDYLVELGWWDDSSLTELYKANQAYLDKIYNYLHTENTSKFFLIGAILEVHFGTIIDFSSAKKQILEDLHQPSPKLDDITFYWLLRLQFFNDEERNALWNYFVQMYEANNPFNTNMAEEERPYSEDDVARYNKYFKQLLECQQDDRHEAESMSYKSEEDDEENVLRKQSSDNELPLTRLREQAISSHLELRDLVEPIQLIAHQLKEHGPEDEHNFDTLSLEFRILYKKLKSEISKYQEHLSDLLQTNDQYEWGGVSHLKIAPPIDDDELLEYTNLLDWAKNLIKLEIKINAKGIKIYRNITFEDELQASPTKKAKLDHKIKSTPEMFIMHEYQIQQYVSAKFFRVKPKNDKEVNQPYPLKPGCRSKHLYDQMKRAIKSKNNVPIDLEESSARSVIIALARILKEHKKVPNGLCFKIGETIIVLESKPTINQVGNAYVNVENMPKFKFGTLAIPSSYKDDSIYKYLNSITNNDPQRAQYLAKLLSQRSKKIIAFTAADFMIKGWKKFIKLPPETALNINQLTGEDLNWLSYYIHFLNHLNFLRNIFEVVRKLYRDDQGQVFPYKVAFARYADSLPISCAQARTSKLLQSGDISMHDAYGNSKVESKMNIHLLDGKPVDFIYDEKRDRALYGAATGSFSSEQDVVLAEYKIKLINKKYRQTFFDDKNKSLPYDACKHYEEMVSEFGAGSESSGSDSEYDNEQALSFKLE